jgi:hypothetical protein
MNTSMKWIDQEVINIHQNDLYREADNERLAHEVAKPSRINSVYATAMASLGSRMIMWGTTLQKRAGQPRIKAA